jgi:hypothetical protein
MPLSLGTASFQPLIPLAGMIFPTKHGSRMAGSYQSYPNAAPILSNPSSYDPMDQSTWTPQTLPHRYAWFHVSQTAATIDQNDLTNAGKSINDVVNQVEHEVLAQAPTLIVNAGLSEGITLTVIGVAVDAGYSSETVYRNIPGYPVPLPRLVYKVWYALYLTYDSNSGLQVASVPTGTLDTTLANQFQVATLVAIVVFGIVLAIVGVVAVIVLGNWLKSMTTETDTTTSVNTITNPSNQAVNVQIPGDGTVTIPPGGSYTWSTTSTSTKPNLGGIITVGAVAIGLVGVGIFAYFITKGLQKPK